MLLEVNATRCTARTLLVALFLFMPHPGTAQQPNPYGPQTTFKTENVLPPSAVYVGPDDKIAIYVRNPSVPATVHVNYLLLTAAGLLIANSEDFTGLSVGAAPSKFFIPATEGYLISLSLFAPTTSRGQVFARAFLQRGNDGPTPVIDQVLVQGYVSDDDRLGYPQSPTESALSGRGWVHGVVLAQPAAGLDFTVTVPAGVRWKIKSVANNLVTSAAAANRLVQAEISDSSFLALGFVPPFAIVPASSNGNFVWGEGLAYGGSGTGFQGVPIFTDLVLGPGWHFSTFTQNIQAADRWQNPVAFVEEWVAQ